MSILSILLTLLKSCFFEIILYLRGFRYLLELFNKRAYSLGLLSLAPVVNTDCSMPLMKIHDEMLIHSGQ